MSLKKEDKIFTEEALKILKKQGLSPEDQLRIWDHNQSVNEVLQQSASGLHPRQLLHSAKIRIPWFRGDILLLASGWFFKKKTGELHRIR